MKNGYPMWKDLWQQKSLWYESGKWQVGYETDYDGDFMFMVDSTSNTFADCPELVESWSPSFSSYVGTSSVEITCRTAIKPGK